MLQLKRQCGDRTPHPCCGERLCLAMTRAFRGRNAALETRMVFCNCARRTWCCCAPPSYRSREHLVVFLCTASTSASCLGADVLEAYVFSHQIPSRRRHDSPAAFLKHRCPHTQARMQRTRGRSLHSAVDAHLHGSRRSISISVQQG